MAFTYSLQNVIDRVSQDIRLQLASTPGSQGQPVLIDYANRVQLEMLRFSRWIFLRSDTLYFMTAFGQTDYWIGPNAKAPVGMVNTALNLSDVDYIQQDSVWDVSHNRQLTAQTSQPLGFGLNFASGQTRPAEPRVFFQDESNSPNVLRIFPASDNENTYQPVPEPPILSSTAGGALPVQVCYTRVTFVDSLGNESTGSTEGAYLNVPANNLLVVTTPTLNFTANATGVQYSSYNVYVGATSGSEVLQTASPIAIGVNWTEPTSGLIGGVSVPTKNNVAAMRGYIIRFRYYKVRTALTAPNQPLLIPDQYIDVLVEGVNARGWKLCGKLEDAQSSYALFRTGLMQMIADKNMFPATDFVRPDTGSFVNQQTIGVLPSTI